MFNFVKETKFSFKLSLNFEFLLKMNEVAFIFFKGYYKD